MARRSLPNRSISHEATPNAPPDDSMGDSDAGSRSGRLTVQLREERGARRSQLTLRLQNALGGDADVVIRLQGLLDEAAKRLVLEEIEPLRVAQRDLPRLGLAAPELRRAPAHQGACNWDLPCNRSSAAVTQTMRIALAAH